MKATLIGGPHDGTVLDLPDLITAINVASDGVATATAEFPGATLYLRSSREHDKFYFSKESDLWP